jgi:hypothetical protein
LFVAEALNGRVSELTLAGDFIASYNAPFAAGSLTASTHAKLIATRSDDEYAGVLNTDGAPKPALARARALSRPQPPREERWLSLPGHDLIVADSSGTWVFDQATGDLCRYHADGSLQRCTQLPSSILARVRAYRMDRVTAFEKGTGLHVRAAPLAKDMVLAGAWLALLLPLPEMPIVLLSTNDASLTPVLSNANALPDWVRSATSFACDGRSFILVGEEGIGRLYLTPSRISQ